jgi:hypothetical protein
VEGAAEAGSTPKDCSGGTDYYQPYTCST